MSSGQNSQKQEDPEVAPADEIEPEKGQNTSEDKAETPSVHVHEWIDEVVWHDEVTHIEHHDAVTEERWVSVPVRINHYICNTCRKEFTTQEEAYAHEDATYMAAIDANLLLDRESAGHLQVRHLLRPCETGLLDPDPVRSRSG